MKPTAIEAKVHRWFRQRYPEVPDWRSKTFHCFRDVPIELRMVVVTEMLEAEITNGGLAQLMWNVFFHWRTVFADADAGYELIGASAQREALKEFRILFEHYEAECRGYIERCLETGEFDYFNQWCDFGEKAMSSESENLFWMESGLRELRLQWMASNARKLSAMMTAS
ncbi:MAG: DUF4375 domain-containing protein [Verrucomicrobia bacterium]|nr:DUF4375 domain-containing protein [Verrucomicrobiota bacterium]